MPLNKLEFEQVKIALEGMQNLNLENYGGRHVLLHNVLVILERYTEEFAERLKKKEKE